MCDRGRMRRPIPLRRTGLTAKDFRLIGEIVVLSGMIEDTLKRMPLAMLRVRHVPGIAMIAHQTVNGLCDMVLAITPYFVASDELNSEVEAAISLVRTASKIRNDIVHGPFWFFNDKPFKGTRKLTARSKGLQMSERHYEGGTLEDALAKHIAAWLAIADCYAGMVALAEARQEMSKPVLREDFYEKYDLPKA